MEVTFQSHPDVVIASNTFRRVPTILQFEDIPLLEVGKSEKAGKGDGFTVKFPIYHNDGNKIAVVKGTRIFLTDEGKRALVNLRHLPTMIVCELEGKPILELRREHGARALDGWAELYAPEGVLIKANDSTMSALLRPGAEELRIGGTVLRDSIFDGHAIGIHVTRSAIQLGVRGRSMSAKVGNWHVTSTGDASVTLLADKGPCQNTPRGRSK